MANPDLMNVTSTGQPAQSVPGVAYITSPLPPIKAPTTKYYVCTVLTASLHRTDGKRLPFIFGFLETDLFHDQYYLDLEIANGNPYIGYATEVQIQAYKMKKDPRGTIEAELRDKLEPEMKAQLEAQIIEALAAKLGFDPATLREAMEVQTPQPTPVIPPGVADGQALSAVDKAKAELARIKGGVKTGTGTIMIDNRAPALQGIQSTADLAAASVSGK